MVVIERVKTITGPVKAVVTNRQRFLMYLLGIPALIPIAMELPAILTMNGATLHGSGNDVFGTGGALLLFTMLAITPLRTIFRKQWFVPLRRWYGVIFAVNIFLDAIAASNDTAFNGPVFVKLANHSFLILGLTMTLFLVPLFIQGVWNKWTMKQLGKYWKPIQKFGTYGIWFLLFIHLALLQGFGPRHSDAAGPDRFPFDIFHQRVYDYLACSALLIVMRIPAVRRSFRLGGSKWKWIFIIPLVVVFAIGYGFFVNELFFKGIAAYHLNPIND